MTKVQLSQIQIFTKKASLKVYQRPQFSIEVFKILTVGKLDNFYVKMVWIFQFFNFVIFNPDFSKVLQKNLVKLRIKIKKCKYQKIHTILTYK